MTLWRADSETAAAGEEHVGSGRVLLQRVEDAGHPAGQGLVAGRRRGSAAPDHVATATQHMVALHDADDALAARGGWPPDVLSRKTACTSGLLPIPALNPEPDLDPM